MPVNVTKAASLAGLCLALASCMHQRGSQVAHDMGRTTNGSSAFQWSAVPHSVIFGLERPGAVVLPEDNPISLRVSFWADTIDTWLRQRDPEHLATTPKPYVRVVADSDINAFGSPSSLPLDLIVQAFSARVDPSDDLEGLSFSRVDGSFKPGWGKPKASSYALDKQIEAFRWALQTYPECTFTNEGPSVHLSSGCKTDGVNRPGVLAIRTASNQLTVLTGMIAAMTEDQLVAVLAHELGHYYMAHLAQPESTYGYYYMLKQHNPDHKPVADAEATRLGDQLTKAQRKSFPMDFFKPVPGQRFHNLIYASIKKSAPLGCSDFDDYVRSSPVQLASLPYDVPSDSVSIAAYQKYESLLVRCAQTVPFKPDALSKALTEATFGSNMAQQMQPYPPFKNLLEGLDYISQRLNTLPAKWAQDIAAAEQAMLSTPVGQYTTEQEADELAMEWLSQLGIDPRNLATSMMVFAKLAASPSPFLPGEISRERCLQLFANNWRDEQGKEVIVPIANWGDIHHSGCYRAYNATREIAIHGLDNFSLHQRPTPPGDAWSVIAAKAAAAHSKSTPAPGVIPKGAPL